MRIRGLVLLLAMTVPVSGLIGGTLTVTKDGGGDGFIRVNGVDQTLPFSRSYAAGTSLTLEAVPDWKSLFENWSGSALVNGADNPVSFNMPLFGNVSITAGFSLSPPDIDSDLPGWTICSTLVGSTCYNDISISNAGGQTLVVVSLSITGTHASEFHIANASQAFNIAAGASHTLTVGFTPASGGNKSATLNITCNDPDENPFQVNLYAQAFTPDIALNPAAWGFGSVSIGGHSDKTFAVRNDGDGILLVSSTLLTGSGAPEYAIRSGGGSYQLDPGTSRDVTVRFAPVGTGVKKARLTFNSNDPDESLFNVDMSGTGTEVPGETHPDIASNPAGWDYGPVNAGSHLDKTFVISNAGTADLSVTAVSLSGADAPDFRIRSGGGPFTLAPASTRTVVVRFSPAGSGGKSASLSFTSNDPDENPFLVQLSGGRGVSIVVDGNKDGFYGTLTGPENGFLNIPSPMYNLMGAPGDDCDLSARVWTAWDDTYLYLYEEVTDDTVRASNAVNWQNDGLELKIDPDPSKKAETGVKSVILTALDSADTEPAYYAGIADLPGPSDFARRRTADGYILELRLKWSEMTVSGRGPVVPAVGGVFGLAINQVDNDRSARQAMIQWAAKLDDEVWRNPRLHGKVTFQAGHTLLMEARNAIVDTLVNPLAALYAPNDLPWPMLAMDVGSVRTAGSASHDAAAGTYTVSGSGADIWDTADGFQYAFRQVSGDVAVTARISGLTESDPWTKGGLMIRDGLAGNSAHAMMAVASDNGLTFQYRVRGGSSCTYAAGGTAVRPPTWLRITRSKNTFIGAASADGAAWVQVGRKVIVMNDPVYAGMAVTAHRDGELSTATFTDVAFSFTGATGVREAAASGEDPRTFALSPNYPNPFNPVTRLSYDLPRPAAVKIVIYDVTGREVRTLADQVKPAGRHTVEFDASGLGGGLYYCDMLYGGRHFTRKMLLLK